MLVAVAAAVVTLLLVPGLPVGLPVLVAALVAVPGALWRRGGAAA